MRWSSRIPTCIADHGAMRFGPVPHNLFAPKIENSAEASESAGLRQDARASTAKIRRSSCTKRVETELSDHH